MGQINIDIEELNTSISEFEALQNSWSNSNGPAREVSGGGSTVNQLEEIAKLYETLYTNIGTLLSGTISFLNKTKQEYETSDLAMATKIKRE